MIAGDASFNSSFYATVAGILPIFLLVQNLTAFYVARQHFIDSWQSKHWMRKFVADIVAFFEFLPKRSFAAMITVLANLAAESACLVARRGTLAG